MVNEWTADDLPRIGAPDPAQDSVVEGVLDAVLHWLNKHHPKSASRGDAALADHLGRQAEAIDELQLDLEAAERERDRWRRAHEIVEAERDQARDERDEAVARAEAAESRLADPYSQANQDAAAWDRVAAHPALRMDLLPDVEGSYADRVFERITWLAEVEEAVTEMKPAEAAEARTTPAVTKRELRSVVGAHDPGDDELAVSRVNALTYRLWSLVSGADPAVFVVRESDLPEAWRDRDGLWRAGQSSYCRVTPEDMRSVIPATLGMVSARESVARAIEAEEAEAVDPVEELAGQIESATRDAIRQVCDTFATVAPPLDPLAVEQAMEVTAASRKIAAHVLGQEVK